MVIKGGVIAYSQMGDPNASIPTPQPVFMRPMWGGLGKSVSDSCIAFVSALSVEQVCYIELHCEWHIYEYIFTYRERYKNTDWRNA